MPTTPLAWQVCVKLCLPTLRERRDGPKPPFLPIFPVFCAPRLPHGKFLPLQALKTLIFAVFMPILAVFRCFRTSDIRLIDIGYLEDRE